MIDKTGPDSYTEIQRSPYTYWFEQPAENPTPCARAGCPRDATPGYLLCAPCAAYRGNF